TTVYVDVQDDKMKRSGFLVTGREASKDEGFDIFKIDGSTTTVYVDDNDGGKMRRSGFLVTGREAEKGDKSIVDITGSRTNLTTSTLSIANNKAVADDVEEPAPVAALQFTEQNLTMTDITIENNVRPVLDDVEKNNEYYIYMSDAERDFGGDPIDYDYTNTKGYFMIDMSKLVSNVGEFYNNYNHLASFHDDLIVPLSSKDAILMVNGQGEETAVVQDAVAAVFSKNYSYYGTTYYYIYAFPLVALSDFKFSFAMTDFEQTSIISGNATKHTRFNVTLNSTKNYGKSYIDFERSQIPYTAMVTTADGVTEAEEISSTNGYDFNALFGETVELKASDIPNDKLFSYWLINGRRYSGNPLNLLVESFETSVKVVFKDESKVLWVDGSVTVSGDGSKNSPCSNFADALAIVATNDDDEIGFRINAKNIGNGEILFGEALNNKARYITIDFTDNADLDLRDIYYGWSSEQPGSVINKIDVGTNVQIIVRNSVIMPEETTVGCAVNVGEDGNLSLENGVLGSYNYNGPIYSIRGANVESNGELTLANVFMGGFSIPETEDDNCGGGVYVAADATLTLKSQSEISCNWAEMGGGVYLENGATLNASSGVIASNVAEKGADVYVEDASANLNLYMTASAINMIGLGSGAFVTATGEPIKKVYNYEDMPVAFFDYIANPDAVVVVLPNETEAERRAKIFNEFAIDNEQLMELGYEERIGAEGKPVRSNSVYSKGKIALRFTGGFSDEISYTYYRNEAGDEYLYLKDAWNNGDYGYRNYWLAGDKIYCDTMYCGNGTPMYAYPIYNYKGDQFASTFDQCNWSDDWDWENVKFVDARPDGNLFAAGNLTDGNGITVQNGAVLSLNDVDAFKSNFTSLKSLLSQLIGVKGRGLNLGSDLQDIAWTNNYTLFGATITPEKIAEKENGGPNGEGIEYEGEIIMAYDDLDVVKYRYEHRKQLLEREYDYSISAYYDGGLYIDEMFRKLRENDFTLTAEAAPNGKIMIGGQEFSGSNKYNQKLAYGTTITLVAEPTGDDCSFSTWSDGCTDATRTVMVTRDMTLKAHFAKHYTVHNADEIDNALSEMEVGGEYVVYIDSDDKIDTYINIYNDKKVTFIGNGNTTLGYDKNKNGVGVFRVSWESNVTIKNLTIDGSYISDGNTYMTNGIKVGYNTDPATLTLENVKIQNCSYGVACSDWYYVYITESEITDNKRGLDLTDFVWNFNKYSKVVVSGGTITNNITINEARSGNEVIQTDAVDVDIYANSNEHVDLTITGNANIGTICMNGLRKLNVGTIANNSSNPINITFKSYIKSNGSVYGQEENIYWSCFKDVEDLSSIEDQQLFVPINSIDIAEVSKKFHLATHDYFIDAEGIIRKSYEFDASGEDFGLQNLQDAIESTPETARASAIYIAKDFNDGVYPPNWAEGLQNLYNETPDGCTLLIDCSLNANPAPDQVIKVESGNKFFGLTKNNTLSSMATTNLFEVSGGALTLVSGIFKSTSSAATVCVINGGTVTICDGVTISGEDFGLGIQLNSGKLNIKGGIITKFRSDAAVTVNDGDVEITGGTIQNCNSSGSLKLSGGSGTIKNLRLINNSGSGVYITGGNYEFENCTFNDNAFSGGSGKPSYGLCIRVGGGTASFNNCSISNNRVVAGGSCDMYGVGAYISSGTASFNNCTISNNYMIIKKYESGISTNNNLYGVGLYAEQEDGKTTNLTISNTTISDNNIVISEDEVVTEEDEVVTMDNYQEGDEKPNPHDGIQYLIKAGVNYNGTVLEEDLKQN
ncbi:MAG: right-handed parallel beta-helix repeat-containing protein, partial [Salinivirgaceae bacterium]|nr:right-handed parallel beta-helix repeat-containing protein [Salinivirgaceae bacterium]